MKISRFNTADADKVIELFTNVFTASEGESEGATIGALVSDLITSTNPSDLIGFVALEGDQILGCIFFSRFNVPTSQSAFILSPVAIADDVQGSGIGQRLINYGLSHLKALDVELVFTYGNPSYYSKTGFEQIDEGQVEAPFPLSQPIGWLAQSLDGNPIQSMHGTTQCVAALSDPKYW